MALIVDAAGKRTANPKTGKVNGATRASANGGGAAALLADLNKDSNVLPQVKKPTSDAGSLSSQLSRKLTPGRSQPARVMPSVQTASMTPQAKRQSSATASPEPTSYVTTTNQPAGMTSSPGSSGSYVKPIGMDDMVRSVDDNILSPLGIDIDHEAGLDAWEQMRAQAENRPARMANMWDEEYDEDGAGGGWFDNQLDYVGNTATNDAYMRYAVDNGYLSADDAWAIMHKSTSLAAEQEMRDTKDVSDDVYGNVGHVIDDGTKYDYAHMTSDKMTGAQYLKYVELGMGGRPVEQIDPSKVYSKRREQVNYDFIPFTPDTATYASMAVGNALETPGRLGSMVGNLRETVTPDYSIMYGEKDNKTKISGRDFDRLSTPYLHQFQYFDAFDPQRYLTNQGNENTTALIREYTVPDVSGRDTYHYGGLTAMWANDDGTYTAEFSDGSSVDVSQEYLDSISNGDGSVTMRDSARVPVSQAKGKVPKNLDALNDVDAILAAASESGGSPLDYADVIYIPDLILSDGTRMSLDDVQRLYYDQTPGNDANDLLDDDITYGFQGGIVNNKPRRLNKREMFERDESGRIRPDFSDVGNNAIDWTLGSLPISIGRMMPWLYAASNAIPSIVGADPGTYDTVGDSYGLIAGNYDKSGNISYGVSDAKGNRDNKLSDSTRWWNTLGNAAVPLTEMLVGPVGEELIPVGKGLERVFGKVPSNPTLAQLVRNELVGMAEEGIEEDLGNIFDELTQYGPAGLFTNQVTDANGNPLYDTAGHEVRDYGTTAEDRLANALDPSDLLNSFAGGAVVDALMQSIPFLGQAVPAARRDAARRKTGVQQYVDPDERERRRLSQSYLEGFNDQTDEEE